MNDINWNEFRVVGKKRTIKEDGYLDSTTIFLNVLQMKIHSTWVPIDSEEVPQDVAISNGSLGYDSSEWKSKFHDLIQRQRNGDNHGLFIRKDEPKNTKQMNVGVIIQTFPDKYDLKTSIDIGPCLLNLSSRQIYELLIEMKHSSNDNISIIGDDIYNQIQSFVTTDDLDISANNKKIYNNIVALMQDGVSDITFVTKLSNILNFVKENRADAIEYCNELNGNFISSLEKIISSNKKVKTLGMEI